MKKTVRIILILVLLSTGIAVTGYCESGDGSDWSPKIVQGAQADYLIVPASGKVYTAQKIADGTIYFSEAMVLGFDNVSGNAEAQRIDQQSKSANKPKLVPVKIGK
jgi:threonine dehydrogenase-like Zn-dependent dehydrogenase